MSRQGHDSNYPNQLYGWQILDNSGWGLYSEDGTQVLKIGPTGAVFSLPGLPTSDPHVANQIYSSSGTLKISAG